MPNLKTKIKILPLTITVTLSLVAAACHDDDSNSAPLTGDAYYAEQAATMLSNMTIEDKLHMLSGPGTANQSDFSVINNTVNPNSVAVGYINGVVNDVLDIPAAHLDDGPAGVKVVSNEYSATAWPIGSLLASTWDKDLMEAVGKAFGNEVKEFGVDFILAPGMNIQRNPLAGRNFEYLSEDPILSGYMASAIVNGLESQEVGATIKHFFGNESETNRDYLDTIATPRALREIYLRGFQIAVEDSQPWAVMSPYNKVNGTYVDQRKDVLTDILRGEWGFDGMVMSDWSAGDVGNDINAAANMIKAGNDLIQPGNQYDDLLTSYQTGNLSEKDIDESVKRILTQLQKTSAYQRYEASYTVDNDAHAILERKAAADGMVLLKNNNALPLSSGSNVASFGVGQLATYKGGLGSGSVYSAYMVNVADGLSGQYTLDNGLVSFYQKYFDEVKVPHRDSWYQFAYYSYKEASPSSDSTLNSLVSTAAENDEMAIITFNRINGEGADRAAIAGDYLLSDDELDLINTVSTAFHAKGKKVAVVLNVAGVVDTSQWSDKVDAILLAYMGGQETGNAVADILSGAVNPSGKLAQTFPASYSDVPSASTFPGHDNNGDGVVDEIFYNEDIYVGYRYYNTFNKAVSYPFGHGLSYTSFNYENAAITSNTLSEGARGKLDLQVTIENSGGVAGREVAQVYVSAPTVKLAKPTIELKSFSKTSLLSAGERQTLDFSIPARDLASFDESTNKWIIEPGVYKVYISPSSDISGNTAITFTIRNEIIIGATTNGAIALPNGVTASDFVTISQ
ncbi:glycoside hydrolase family 3 N-terminal domain-containing protein [Aeromonas caviae]|uniref:glycoside hydrolase family 3 N-terminal domain-containing protein n=1 Tax=Aeromonas caviae TaxID=648 RepID=UPI0038D151AC